MPEWTALCAVEQAPTAGEVAEHEAMGRTLCVANIHGELHVLDNLCPHRDGPLGQGWVEGQTVVCPWHAWAFDCTTGMAEPPERAQVRVYGTKVENGVLLVNME